MKKLIFILPFCLIMFISFDDLHAQKEMKSAPATATGKIDDTTIEIKYHQPVARGRKIMGELVPYGEVWRTGANNATTISFDTDVEIEGNDLPKGTYSLFTIPGEKEWTIIFNKNANQWGAFNYDKADDALRIKVKPKKTDSLVETFNISIGDEDVIMAWENTKVMFKVDD